MTSTTAPSPLSPAVEVHDLAHRYPGGRLALDGVSFAVEPGTVFGFLGPNGSGKSTLFRILATLLAPTRGRVTVGGTTAVTAVTTATLPDDRAEVRRRLGVVFQNPSLDLQLTVAENLRCQGRLHGLGRAEIARRSGELLERFGLADRADERTATLSGGLRRRTELAKALLHRPPVLLLDEPSTGLDPRARRELWDTLAGLTREGMTALVTTHFTDAAERMDRLLLLDEGRAVAEGTPAELVAAVGDTVLTVTPAAEGGQYDEAAATLAREITALLPDLPRAPAVHRGRVRFEHADAPRLVARIAEALGDRIDGIAIARPTLEDVFLARTGHDLHEAPPEPATDTPEVAP